MLIKHIQAQQSQPARNHSEQNQGLLAIPLIPALRPCSWEAGCGAQGLPAQRGWGWVPEPHQAAPVAKQTPLPTHPPASASPPQEQGRGGKCSPGCSTLSSFTCKKHKIPSSLHISHQQRTAEHSCTGAHTSLLAPTPQGKASSREKLHLGRRDGHLVPPPLRERLEI